MATSEHHKALQELLQNSEGPMSADEIRESLGHRSIGMATVYRLLKRGVEDGQYHEVTFPDGPSRFEIKDLPHHHHFICLECDKAFDIEGCTKQVLNLAPKGFQVEEHDIILRGRCPECPKAS